MGTSQIEVPPSQFFGFDRIDRNLSDNQMLINVINRAIYTRKNKTRLK